MMRDQLTLHYFQTHLKTLYFLHLSLLNGVQVERVVHDTII
jgi:hypothetical protein